MGSNTATPADQRSGRLPELTPERRRRRATLAIAVTAAIALASCGGGGDDSSTAAEQRVEEPAASPNFDASEGGAPASQDAPGDTNSDLGNADSGGFDIGIIGRDVIIEMSVVVSSDNVQRTVASIMAQASALGGGVASSNVNYGSPGDSSNQAYAVLVVKVPPQAIDSLLAGLDDTGTVQSINQSAQDVTEQLIDLGVRISNARQSVANVRDFMDRAENLNELVTLEGELTRRQTELERLEAQQRNLSERVALSTMTIEVVPTASIPEPIDDDSDTISDAFRQGWEAFADFLFGIGFILAVVLPFIGLAAIVLGAAWLLLRRRNKRRSATHGSPPAASRPTSDQPLAAPPTGSAATPGSATTATTGSAGSAGSASPVTSDDVGPANPLE